MILKKCKKCGAMVEIIEDCHCRNCGIQCCGEKMEKIASNNAEFSFEKHLPQVEICGNYIEVTVNHVMEDAHYIEWVALETKGTLGKKYFKAGDAVKAIFPYVKNSTIYSYCNKHGLFEVKVK